MSAYQFSSTPRDVPKVNTVHRNIHTQIPAPGTAEVLARLDAVESRSMHGQLPIEWDYAVGHSVFDHAQNKFIDFTSGIFVSNVGHSNPVVLQAIADEVVPHSYSYATQIRAAYLEKLTSWSGFEKAFLLSAGTEATEACLKLMRMWGMKQGKRRPGIICIDGNWHGRTMGAQLMSGNLEQKAWIGLHDTNMHSLPFPYPWVKMESVEVFLAEGLAAIERKGIDLTRDVAGFMLETFQGWGAIFYPPAYVQAIRRLCDTLGILLCFDEMQSGFARTGRKFGYEHYDVVPDLIAVGKGMGGGMPLSGVLGRAEILDLPEVGNMSSTHGGNPLCCAAGLAVIEEIERLDLVREAERKGELLHAALAELPTLGVYGKGMIAALHFGSAEFSSRVCEKCMERGLLVVHTGRESIKIGPPLVIPDAALVEGVQVLGEAIAEVAA